MNPAKAFLKAISSLRLTVVLFALSMVLILAGTLAARPTGAPGPSIILPLHLRRDPLPDLHPAQGRHNPRRLPLPAGSRWASSSSSISSPPTSSASNSPGNAQGIILAVHAGVLLLLVGEFVAGGLRQRRQHVHHQRVAPPTTSRTSRTANSPSSIPAAAPTTSSSPSPVLPRRQWHHLQLAPTLRRRRCPLDGNAFGPMQQKPPGLPTATAGRGLQISAAPIPAANGIDGNTVDVPSAYITLSKAGKSLGTYLVCESARRKSSSMGSRTSSNSAFKHHYKPYSLKLIDFRHDKFVTRKWLATSPATSNSWIPPAASIVRSTSP